MQGSLAKSTRAALATGMLLASLLAPAAADDRIGYDLTITAGGNQTRTLPLTTPDKHGSYGEIRFAPMEVVVKDVDGKPVRGIRLRFTCSVSRVATCEMDPHASYGPSLDRTTDANGRAGLSDVRYYHGGARSFTITVQPIGLPVGTQLVPARVVFNLTVLAKASAYAVHIVSGDGQNVHAVRDGQGGTAPTNAIFAPLVVRVTNLENKPANGVQVTFRCRSGIPCLFGSHGGDFTTSTNQNGDATAHVWTQDRCGNFSVDVTGPAIERPAKFGLRTVCPLPPPLPTPTRKPR